MVAKWVIEMCRERTKTQKLLSEAMRNEDTEKIDLYRSLLSLYEKPDASVTTIIMYEIDEGHFWTNLEVEEENWDELFAKHGEDILHTYFYKQIPESYATKEEIDNFIRDDYFPYYKCPCYACEQKRPVWCHHWGDECECLETCTCNIDEECTCQVCRDVKATGIWKPCTCYLCGYKNQETIREEMYNQTLMCISKLFIEK